jgi:hypothetical protein
LATGYLDVSGDVLRCRAGDEQEIIDTAFG